MLYTQCVYLRPGTSAHLVGTYLADGLPKPGKEPAEVGQQRAGVGERRPVHLQRELLGRREVPPQPQPGDRLASGRLRQPSSGEYVLEELGSTYLDSDHIRQQHVPELPGMLAVMDVVRFDSVHRSA